MRIAVLADIHGNVLALDAVLADLARRGGADLTVNLATVSPARSGRARRSSGSKRSTCRRCAATMTAGSRSIRPTI